MLQHVLNGWTLAPIIKLRSGLPFTITNGNVDANLDGNTNDRAQLIGRSAHRQPHAGPVVQYRRVRAEQGRDRRRRSTATRRATCSTVPGFQVVDLALSRDFQLPGRIQADASARRAPTSSTS